MKRNKKAIIFLNTRTRQIIFRNFLNAKSGFQIAPLHYFEKFVVKIVKKGLLLDILYHIITAQYMTCWKNFIVIKMKYILRTLAAKSNKNVFHFDCNKTTIKLLRSVLEKM